MVEGEPDWIDADDFIAAEESEARDSWIDADSFFAEEDKDQTKKKGSEEIGLGGTLLDIGTQLGLGAAKYFTWPLDVIKIGMIGEGLADLDELESLFEKEGKPFDKDKYIKDVFEGAQWIPTQELAEKGFEELTGISLEPKTGLGKKARQVGGISAFTPGGLAAKASRGILGATTTAALEAVGVGEGKSELIGDIASLTPAGIAKEPRKLASEVAAVKRTADKHALPFIEAMARENMPRVRGVIAEKTADNLKKEMNLSVNEAIEKILHNDLPMKRLKNRGVNLDALATHAYQQTMASAKSNPQVIRTDDIVKAFDTEVRRIKSLAPSPSDAQQAAINLMEREGKILKVSKPNSEQLIQQHMNYNSDMKQLYKKPEFTGKENEVRRAYEFMKDELVNAMEKQGNRNTANSFKAANKIYAEKLKMEGTEKLLGKAFDGKRYDPKKLHNLLNSKQGNLLKRNLSPNAIKDIEDIAKYGKHAQEKMSKYLQIDNSSIKKTFQSFGKIAPFILYPITKTGAVLSTIPATAEYIQGKLLTRPATREIYKSALKNAADEAFDLVRKDMVLLENVIEEEYGTLDNFFDSAWDELEFSEE